MEAQLKQKLFEVKNYQDLLVVALWFIDQTDAQEMVCGPIFSDGPDKTADNLALLEQIITTLLNEGHKIFNQIPFLDINVAQETQMTHFETALKFQEFYFPLFASGKIKKVYFTRRWETSRGSVLEHESVLKNNIPIVYISD